MAYDPVMKNIYDAQDIIDAQRIIALLEHEGIPAQVKGEYLSGAMGELPVQGLVSVWVADQDATRAREIVTSADHEPGLPDDLDIAEAPVVIAPSRGGAGVLGFLGVLLLGAAVGYVLAYGQLRLPWSTETSDADGNGVTDTVYHYRGQALDRIEIDRNEDGRPDQVHFSPNTPDSRSELDDDFDGDFETRMKYRAYQVHWLESDLDGDGHFEWHHDFNRGVLATGTLRSRDGTVLKQQRYEAGTLAGEEFDADGDGTLETRRRFDTRGEQVQ